MRTFETTPGALPVRAVSSRQLLTIAPLAAGGAAVLNALLYGLGTAAGIMDPAAVVSGGQSITLLPVIIASIVPVLGAALVLAGLNLFLARPFRVFNLLALLVLLLSFTNPYAIISNVPALMAIWLNLMHVVVAGVVVYTFNRWAGKKA